MDPRKVESILNWPNPKIGTKVRIFHGLAQLYRKLIWGIKISEIWSVFMLQESTPLQSVWNFDSNATWMRKNGVYTSKIWLVKVGLTNDINMMMWQMVPGVHRRLHVAGCRYLTKGEDAWWITIARGRGLPRLWHVNGSRYVARGKCSHDNHGDIAREWYVAASWMMRRRYSRGWTNHKVPRGTEGDAASKS